MPRLKPAYVLELQDKLIRCEKHNEWLRWSNFQLYKKLVDLEEKHNILLKKNKRLTLRNASDAVPKTNVPGHPREEFEELVGAQNLLNLNRASSSLKDPPCKKRPAKGICDALMTKMETYHPNLPSEVLLMIFEKVDDAQTWLNFYRTSSSLEELLGEKRTSALLLDVLQLLLKQNVISMKDILSCRLVSPEWKVKATKAFKNHLISEEDLDDNFLNRNWNHISGRVELQDIHSIQSFLHDMRDHQGNPFVGRIVHLHYLHENDDDDDDNENEEDRQEEFWKMGISFLEKYGGYIANFQFGSLPIKVDQFRKCLRLIPQVIGLKIFQDVYLPGENYHLARDFLSEINNLKNLHLCMPAELMWKVFLEVFSPLSLEKLKQLHLHMSDGFCEETNSFMVTEILPRLSNLEILSLRMKFSDLEDFRALTLPLKKIYIYQDQDTEEDDVNFLETVFTACISFSDTLVSLFVEYKSLPGHEPFAIYLPQLKHLDLKFTGMHQHLLDFMSTSVPFPHPDPDGLLNNSTESESDENELEGPQKEERSIWKLLPNLDDFIYEGTNHFRPTKSLLE